MKNELNELLEKYKFKVDSYKKIGNVSVISTDNGKFVCKKKCISSKNNINNYLKSKQFMNFLPLHNDERDEYEISPYIESINMSDEDKATNIIYLMSMLHNKTTFYKTVVIDEIKEFYEEKSEDINNINNYYDTMRWIIEEDPYPSPSSYLLLRCIGLIYRSIDIAKKNLDSWYELMKEKKNQRVVMNHNNLSLEHIVVDSDIYFISWEHSKIDSPIYDFLNFYKNNYLEVDFSHLYDIYNLKYKLAKEERHLLFTLLSIPTKIKLESYEINKTKEVYKKIRYLDSVIKLISEKEFE